ncbi:MAG: DNA polymerase III subunit delta [Candidatus Pacebacteria bacterium]|nr:DNA polymerase III subunit delta [Candidatus Paceibacterota bacterium]
MENNKKYINLYFGDDDFSMAEEMKKEKDLFKKRGDEMNIITIDWKDQSVSQGEKIGKLQEALMGTSLFSSDKLVIIKNSLFSASKKSKEITESEENIKDAVSDLILKYFGNIQAGIKLFFLEENLDKRKKVYKELLKMEKSGAATIKEFTMPLNFQFDNWIKNRVEKQKGKITREVVNALAISLGKGFAQKDKSGKIVQSYNLWEASNEIEKLISYCGESEIGVEDIKLLVKSKVDMNVFNLIDSIGAKNRAKAVMILNKQIEEGLNENYILTMLVYQFRNLIKIKSLLEQGLPKQEIVSQTKLHPFVVQKSIGQCRNFNLENLKLIYKKLFDADLAIKTGKINPNLALDLLVVSMV